MPFQRRPLGQILIELGVVKPEELAEALAAQPGTEKRVGQLLVERGLASSEEIARALAEQLYLPFWQEVPREEVEPELLAQVPLAFAREEEVLPVKRKSGAIIVALADPLDLQLMDSLRVTFGRPVAPVVVSPEALAQAINFCYDQKRDEARQVIADLNEEGLDTLATSLEEPGDLLESADEAPIIRLVNALMVQAVRERASDIHLEPFEKEVSIRFRIDGVLYNKVTIPKAYQPPITSRVKIMAGLDIAEKRLPQDGRIKIRIAGREIDIRVSVVPTSFGERVVLRLLDKSHLFMSLEELGLTPSGLKIINQLIKMSHGIILVTGPTGCGKTTTLYAALNKINSPDKNIITIEDPVEYQLKGIGQIQVNPKIGLSFANGLRSILRQDPDVIMVGEIRDTETAEIAVHAALTGHLVFSTLHTNDASGAITRLIDMGIEPYLVSSAVVAILAQRLVRLICPGCREAYRPSLEEIKELGINGQELASGLVYRGKGCPDCSQTGYRGRTATYELLLVDDNIRELIMKQADASTIRNKAISQGMTSLRIAGAQKALAGLTTIAEVLRVTREDLIV